MNKGTQVRRRLENKDSYEYGFVTTPKSKCMFVLFWKESNNRMLKSYIPECVPLKDLEKHDLHDQRFIDKVIQEYLEG